jgi:DNA-binding CsgD family transcriptional regulator
VSTGAESDLTGRELEGLELVAARLQNKEIAAQLVISEHTFKNHLENILAKLHLRSRRQAATYGVACGWVRPRLGDLKSDQSWAYNHGGNARVPGVPDPHLSCC